MRVHRRGKHWSPSAYLGADPEASYAERPVLLRLNQHHSLEVATSVSHLPVLHLCPLLHPPAGLLSGGGRRQGESASRPVEPFRRTPICPCSRSPPSLEATHRALA